MHSRSVDQMPAPKRGVWTTGSLMLASRNTLLLLAAILVIGPAVTGYALYEEKKKPDGIEISVGKNGLSIKGK
ncbi:hypothetical protein FG93_00399 [Bosea sp. LC85]|nr:hypothetical protein FG93_00399 [Bosea sp. LC85]